MFSLSSIFKSINPDESFQVLRPEEFKVKVKHRGAQLIDVRTPEEYRKGHIPNAKNINFFESDFLIKILNLDASKAVYVYCQSGMRSRKACRILSENGFKEIYDLKGGYLAWM